MKWLPDRMKCTGQKDAASQIETAETKYYCSTGGDHGCFLQRLAGSKWKTAKLLFSALAGEARAELALLGSVSSCFIISVLAGSAV